MKKILKIIFYPYIDIAICRINLLKSCSEKIVNIILFDAKDVSQQLNGSNIIFNALVNYMRFHKEQCDASVACLHIKFVTASMQRVALYNMHFCFRYTHLIFRLKNIAAVYHIEFKSGRRLFFWKYSHNHQGGCKIIIISSNQVFSLLPGANRKNCLFSGEKSFFPNRLPCSAFCLFIFFACIFCSTVYNPSLGLLCEYVYNSGVLKIKNIFF